MNEMGALQKREVDSKLKALRPLVKKVLQSGLIRSDKSNQEAADARRVVVTTKKDVDQAEKKVTKPLNEAKKAAIDLFRPAKRECSEALELIDEKMSEYEVHVEEAAEVEREEIRKKEERRLALLRKNEEKRLAEARSREERIKIKETYNHKKDLVEDEASAQLQTVVEEPTKTEGTQVRMLWDFEVLEVTDIPDEFLIFTVNRQKVLEFARSQAERNITPNLRGLRLFQKPSRASRSL